MTYRPASFVPALLLTCLSAGCAVHYGNAPWTPPAYFDEERETTIDLEGGLDICFLEAGLEHEETIVFVHGWSGNVHNYWDQYEAFADTHRVLVYDQPGHGKSERSPDTQYSLELFGRALLEMLDARGLDEVVLVSNSAGSAIALWAATRQPQRVKQLVISNSTGSGRNGFTGAVLGTVNPRWLRKFDLTTGARFKGDDPKTQAKREFIASFYGTVEERPYLEMLSASLRPTYEKIPPKALRRLDMPVLIIWTDDDPVVGRRPRRYFEQHIEGARTYVIEEGGHTPMQSRPEEFNCAVRRFLAGESLAACDDDCGTVRASKRKRDHPHCVSEVDP